MVVIRAGDVVGVDSLRRVELQYPEDICFALPRFVPPQGRAGKQGRQQSQRASPDVVADVCAQKIGLPRVAAGNDVHDLVQLEAGHRFQPGQEVVPVKRVRRDGENADPQALPARPNAWRANGQPQVTPREDPAVQDQGTDVGEGGARLIADRAKDQGVPRIPDEFFHGEKLARQPPRDFPRDRFASIVPLGRPSCTHPKAFSRLRGPQGFGRPEWPPPPRDALDSTGTHSQCTPLRGQRQLLPARRGASPSGRLTVYRLWYTIVVVYNQKGGRVAGRGIDIRAFRADLRVLEREVVLSLSSDTGCCGVSVAQCHLLLETEARGRTNVTELAAATVLDKSTLEPDGGRAVPLGSPAPPGGPRQPAPADHHPEREGPRGRGQDQRCLRRDIRTPVRFHTGRKTSRCRGGGGSPFRRDAAQTQRARLRVLRGRGRRSRGCVIVSGKEERPRWQVGEVWAAGRPVPVVSTRLGWQDRLGAVAVRLAIGRGSYRVAPGLYAVGAPSPDSPALVTANYKLTFDALRRELSGHDAWILVLDTRGVNVWCAAGKGTFGTRELERMLMAARVDQVVTHRTLILPQLGAPGVAAHEVARDAGWKVRYGPVRAADLPAYLAAGMKKDDAMRTVTFKAAERMAIAPAELAHAWPFLAAAVAFAVLAAVPFGPGALARALQTGLPLVGAVLVATLAFPALLPWLPFRAFALKGAILGAAWSVLAGLARQRGRRNGSILDSARARHGAPGVLHRHELHRFQHLHEPSRVRHSRCAAAWSR